MLHVSRWLNCWTCARREAEEPGRENCGPCGGVTAVGGCCAQLMTFLISFMAWRLRAWMWWQRAQSRLSTASQKPLDQA